MPRDLHALSTVLAEYSRDPTGANFHAQAHARAILSELGALPDDWPHFSPMLDERLYYASNLQISGGLILLDSSEFEQQAAELLTRGAEAIEFLSGIEGDSPLPHRHELLKAAVAYHLAGHHARSYVLLQRLKRLNSKSSRFTKLMESLIERDLVRARQLTIEFFRLSRYTDLGNANGLAEDEYQPTATIFRLGQRSLVEACSLFLEYVKLGQSRLLDTAREKISLVISLGMSTGLVDLWWWAWVLQHLIKGFEGASLWQNLNGFSPSTQGETAVRRYIKGCAQRRLPVITLWPSQRKAIPWITRSDNPSFCIRMPTSAGKTRIAELAIVKTLIDNIDQPNTKVIYVAPFRSLAVEIERSLSDGLRPIGARVSEIYGGFELSYSEQRLIEQTHVLVLTPEKLDAVLRINPDLLQGVSLVVLDEGHIAGEISERGIGSEFLIQRLLTRFPRTTCRYLFVSAVLPNQVDFANWIAGDQTNVLQSEWRPSRLMVGECVWTGSLVKLEFTHIGRDRFSQPCYVRTFVKKIPASRMTAVPRRRKPFPDTAREAFALSAIRLAQQGTTLVFVPQAQHVESTARSIQDALEIEFRLSTFSREDQILPCPGRGSELWERCVHSIKEELGNDSELLTFLESGIVVHHSRIPARVRLRIEELIRSNGVRLIVATTTLASGVNLPIKSVLVRGLQQGQTKTVDPLTFWNICGRAGRAMVETEGQVLFFIDETKEPYSVRRLKSQIRSLLDELESRVVLGLLYRYIRHVKQLWNTYAPDIEFASLCHKLAEDDFDWVDNSKRPQFIELVSLIDQHLLAITTEEAIPDNLPDALQNMMRGSLLFFQLEAHPIANFDQEKATQILFSRLRSIRRRFPNEPQRKRFYRLNLKLDDCIAIENSRGELAQLFREAVNWANFDKGHRIDLLWRIAKMIFALKSIKPSDDFEPNKFKKVLKAWLDGKKPLEMFEDGLASQFTTDPAHLSKSIEDICVYKLAWGVNTVYIYLNDIADGSSEELPSICSTFSSMFKYGLSDPVSAILVPFLDLDRSLAMKVASICPYGFDEPASIVGWLFNSSAESFEEAGLATQDIDRVLSLRPNSTSSLSAGLGVPLVQNFTIETERGVADLIEVGDPILPAMAIRGTGGYDLYTVSGAKIGTLVQEDNEIECMLLGNDSVELSVIDKQIAGLQSVLSLSLSWQGQPTIR